MLSCVDISLIFLAREIFLKLISSPKIELWLSKGIVYKFLFKFYWQVFDSSEFYKKYLYSVVLVTQTSISLIHSPKLLIFLP